MARTAKPATGKSVEALRHRREDATRTTATVAEQWGRRWITIDTSRVALALARARIMGARYPYYLLADSREGQIKGLEFRAVAVMACDDEVLPLQGRIEAVTDEGDLGEVYETERHLLYVAWTRARDHLPVTGVNPASEFPEDLRT